MTTVLERETGTIPEVRQTRMLIGGRWCNSANGKTFATINPATEEVIAEVAEGDAADIDLAVKAARKAFESGPVAQDGRPRPRPAAQQAGRPDREEHRRAGRPSKRSTTASRSATAATATCRW